MTNSCCSHPTPVCAHSWGEKPGFFIVICDDGSTWVPYDDGWREHYPVPNSKRAHQRGDNLTAAIKKPCDSEASQKPGPPVLLSG